MTDSFTDTGLTASTTYSYKIIALDAALNQSPFSAITTGTTLPGAGLPVPIIQMDFEGISGSSVPDISGAGNNGTGKKGLVGAEVAWSPTTGTDPSGHHSIVFDGHLFERVEIPNVSGKLDVTNRFTCCAWINVDEVDFTDPSNQRWDIFEKVGCLWFNVRMDRGATVPGPPFVLRVGGFFGGVGDESFTGVTQIPSNTWTHVACLYDGANMKTYINGVLDHSQPRSGTLNTGATVSGVDENFVIGAKHQKGHNPGGAGTAELQDAYFDGQIDDFRFWNVVLTPAQINTVLQQGVDTQPPTAPTQVTVNNPTLSSLRVNWQGATDNVGVAQYEISRAIGAGSFSVLNTVAAAADPNVYADTGLTSGTTYQYRIVAIDATGLRSPNSPVGSGSTITGGSPPTTPTSLTATAFSSTEIDLSWVASTDPDGDLAGYQVWRSAGGSPIKITTTGLVTTYKDLTVAASTTYTYFLVAVDAATHTSGNSVSATATTPAGDSAPQVISLPSLSDTAPAQSELITVIDGQYSGSPAPTLGSQVQEAPNTVPANLTPLVAYGMGSF